jgi:hypothetical protein
VLGCVVDADVDRCCQRSDGHFPFGVELNEEANADRLAEHAHVLCDSLGGERVGDRVLLTHRRPRHPEPRSRAHVSAGRGRRRPALALLPGPTMNRYEQQTGG